MPGRGSCVRLLLAMGFALAAALFAAPGAHAAGVVVLRASDLPVYAGTARAFGLAYRRPVVSLAVCGPAPESTARVLARANPAVVVAIGLKAAELAREHLPKVPLVYALVPSPEHHGLTGPRVTGVSAEVPPGLELEALHTLAPNVRRVGVVLGPGASGWIRDASEAAERIGLTLVAESVDGVEELGPRIRELATHSDALWLPADPTVATPEAFRLELAQSLERRIPLLVFAPPLVSAGALAAAAPDVDWVGERLAEMVRRVQAGERPGSIPVTPVRKVRIVANLATARAIGRELPGAALGAAEVVP